MPDEIVYIYGIPCTVKKERFPDKRYRNTYTFTVSGWEPCTVTGYDAAKRVIRGRQDAAVRNTLGKG